MSRSRSTPVAAAVLVAVLLSSACGGSGPAATSVAETPTPTPTGESNGNVASSPASETTDPPASETTDPPVVTTAVSTTVVTSTVAPTVPEPTLASIEVAVERDLATAIASFDECLKAMPDCDVTSLNAGRIEPVRSLTANLIIQGNTEGWVVDDVDSRTFEVFETTIDAEGTEASVTVCEVDATRVWIPADPVAGTAEVVVEDLGFVSTVKTWRLRLIDDQWLAFDIIDEQKAIGMDNNQCI